MARSLRRFGAYLTGNIALKLGQFLLLPLLTPIASGTDLSRFGLFASVVAMSTLVGSLNIHQSIGRTYFDTNDDAERSTVLLSSLLFGLIAATIFMVTLAIVATLLTLMGRPDPLTLGDAGIGTAVVIAVLALTAVQFNAVLLRVIDRPGLFLALSIAQGLMLPVAFLVLVRVGIGALWSAVGAYTLAQASTAVAGILMARSPLQGGHVSLRPVRRALDFSIGTTIHQLVTWITVQSGRWIGAFLLPLATLGGYTLFSFAIMASSVLLTTPYEARRIEVLEAFARRDYAKGAAELSRLMRINLALTCVGFVLALGCYSLQGHFLKPELRLSLLSVVLWLPFTALSVVHNNNYWIAVGTYRTRQMSLAEIPGGLLGIAAAICLAPLMGVNGLIIGSIIGLLIQTVVSTLQARHWLKEASPNHAN